MWPPSAWAVEVREAIGLAPLGYVAGELRVDIGFLAVVIKEIEEPPPNHDVLPQRDRPGLVDHDGGVSADCLDPSAEFLGVAYRGRQAGQGHLFGQVQDDFFPDRTAESVGQEVHFVHDHIRKTMQCWRIRVQHVPQYLGGHHDHRSIGVDRGVSGEQADLLRSVHRDQVVVFLVAQRLDRGGVKALASGRQSQVDREFSDDGLTRTGGCADQHTVAVFQRRARADLKGIESKTQPLGERTELGSDAGHLPMLSNRSGGPIGSGAAMASGASKAEASSSLSCCAASRLALRLSWIRAT